MEAWGNNQDGVYFVGDAHVSDGPRDDGRWPPHGQFPSESGLRHYIFENGRVVETDLPTWTAWVLSFSR